MATVRDHQQSYNRERHTNLIRARQERALHQQRADQRDGYETFDLEHDAQREWELIEGTQAEQEAEADDAYRS